MGYAATHGYLDKEKLLRIADVARGIEIAAAPVEQTKQAGRSRPTNPRSTTSSAIEELKPETLELREAALQSGMERIRFEQKKLEDEEGRYSLLRKAFNEKVLDVDKAKAIKEGQDKIRSIWENMKPKQVKDQILQMIDGGEMTEVVSILSSVATNKQSKIIAEFKTDDEIEKAR